MPKVLVPLDGSSFSELILPYASQLAGRDGELLLLHDITTSEYRHEPREWREKHVVEASNQYLWARVRELQGRGFTARSETYFLGHPETAIGEAAHTFGVDYVACATHARSGLDRALHPSIAWNALSHCKVPVMLRSFQDTESEPNGRNDSGVNILVPLDGSLLAEAALPVAKDLSKQLGGTTSLVRVVPEPLGPGALPFTSDIQRLIEEDVGVATAYLQEHANHIPHASTRVSVGAVADDLTSAIKALNATHVVMCSHGRTGVSRIVLGSVAEDILRAVAVPIVVVPALARVKEAEPEGKRTLQPAGVA